MSRRELFVRQRKKMAMSQEELASALTVSPSTVARWEQGVTDPVSRHRKTLAELWALPLAEIDRLLADDSPAADGDVAPWLGHFAALERGAAALRVYETLYVPTLLQTRDYAEAVESAHFRPVGFDEIEQRVAARLARQKVLDKMAFRCVIDEAVLLRAVGNRRTMAGQMQQLLDVAERPTISLRIAPLATTMHGAGFGTFTLITAPGQDNPYVACTEDLTSMRYTDAPNDVHLYGSLFAHYENLSLSPEESIEAIEQHRRSYDA